MKYWSENEIKLLISLSLEYQNDFQRYVPHFQNRSRSSIKNQYYQLATRGEILVPSDDIEIRKPQPGRSCGNILVNDMTVPEPDSSRQVALFAAVMYREITLDQLIELLPQFEMFPGLGNRAEKKAKSAVAPLPQVPRQ